MKLKLLVILTALVAAACVLADTEEDEVKKLTGSWSLGFEEKLSFYRFVVSEDKSYSWKDKSGLEKGTLSIDATKTPLTIDFHVSQGRFKGKTKKGIYKIENVRMAGRARDVQRLTTCIAPEGSERPSQFSRDEGALTTWLK
jgi:uncharacterized protein (TIGR03067 family)